MPAPLSPTTIALVKASVPALEAHGLEITRRMYARMFQDPAIRALFNQSHQNADAAQPRALAAAVLAYARHIEDLGALADAVERIAQKHVALNILPEHYPHVATALLGAIGEVLGAAATPEILAAWGEAYWFLAELLIGREAAIYRALATAPGGWNGWRDFVVAETAEESRLIRSLTLVPADGGAVLRHRPGQYLGFALDLPGVGQLRRNYSISSAPGDRAYRITVKRDATPGRPAGLASTFLHQAAPGTRLAVAAPAGDFFLDPAGEGPVVLASGGVGQTPLLSMLAAIAEANPTRPVLWAHGAQDGGVHAMGAEVRARLAGLPNARGVVFYAAPEAADRRGTHYDEAGLISPAWLAAAAPRGAAFYVCGPKPFMQALVTGLPAAGIAPSCLHYEFFGPAETWPAALAA